MVKINLLKNEMQEGMVNALDIPEQELKADDQNGGSLDGLVDLIQAKKAVSPEKEKLNS